jgi:hypothetical protein
MRRFSPAGELVFESFSVAPGGAAPEVVCRCARLGRLADVLADADGLRVAFPALCDVSPAADGDGAGLVLSFINVDAEAKFSVDVGLDADFDAGELRCRGHVHCQGGCSGLAPRPCNLVTPV